MRKNRRKGIGLSPVLAGGLLLLLFVGFLLWEGGLSPSPAPTPVVPPSDSTFSVHFIDVGQADSALVLCDGSAMLIDGGNVADSSLVVSYLEFLGVKQLDYLVCTHAHEDHVGGLPGPLNTCTVEHVLTPVEEYDSKAYRDFLHYVDLQALSLTLPVPGEQFSLGSARCTILGPVTMDVSSTNDTSIVLRVDYGETSFLFTGDAERASEQAILDSGAQLSATLLKVGHHGSDSSTSYPFLRAVMPQYAVISVGEGNDYGHPNPDVLSRLRDAGVTVYRTDLHGNIVVVSDGASLTFSTQKGEPPSAEPEALLTYIGNRNRKTFHLSTCSNLPAEQNRTYFYTRQEAIDAGYSPCGNCRP